MRELTLLLLGLVGCSSAYLIKVPTVIENDHAQIAPLGWVHIQKLLLPLFDNICEESTNPILVRLASDFTLDSTNGEYMKAGVLDNLRNLKTGKGLLAKGEIFSEYNPDHAAELKALYEVFFYAKDFDTFYKAAAWARQNVNCGLFVDAIYLAIIKRKDTAKVSVPAPYELLPNYFVKQDAVVRASYLLSAGQVSATTEADVRVEGNSYILDTNYTANWDDDDEDSKLAYFREDVGLNAFYLIRKLKNAPWFNTPNVANNMYGERMFMMMKQFGARYDLERYSHGLPELDGFDWESTMTYDPMLIYSNGNEFDHRTFPTTLTDDEDIAFVKTIEQNISNVVAHLKQAGHNKSQILNHLMEILVTSDKSYEAMCRKLLGSDKDTNERNYSVLEHYMTTLRDPMFWRVNKKMVRLIDTALKTLPSYTRNELFFPGVEVLSVETKKVMTGFDNFLFDVTDSLKTSSNTTFQVKISQPRLNHKPFVMKLNISSLVLKKGLVKMYIGPKMMPGELAIKKHLFVLLDSFEVNLKRGFNVISRSSEEMTSFSNDFISLRALRKKVENAEFGLDALPLKTVDSQIGYPSRLILPKGLSNGLPLQIFVFVAPFTKGTMGVLTTSVNSELNTAVLSPGYPLDLPIEIRQLFGLPNTLVREITVTHKSESGNGGKAFGTGGRPGAGEKPANEYSFNRNFDNTFGVNGNEYNQDNTIINEDFYDDSLLVHGLVGERPEFTYRNKDTQSFNNNKSQYRKKDDYASKRTNYYTPKPNFYLPPDNEIYTISTVTEPNGYIENTIPTHGPLGAASNFIYKQKESTHYTEFKNTENIKNKDAYTLKNNQFQAAQNNIKDKYELNVASAENFVGDEILYDDLLRNRFMLNDKLDRDSMVDTTNLKEIKDDNLKKDLNRIAKIEQKKERYIMKGEQKKDENINKREQKIQEHLAKREKHLNDLMKKSTGKKVINVDIDGLLAETNYENLHNTNMQTNKGAESTTSQENDAKYISNADAVSHYLLTSNPDNSIKKDVSKYKTVTYKKKTEKYGSTKVQDKKTNFREEFVTNDDIKPGKAIKINEMVKTKPNILFDDIKPVEKFATDNKGKTDPIIHFNTDTFVTLDTKNIEVYKDSKTLQKNIDLDTLDTQDYENNGVYSDTETIKDINKDSTLPVLVDKAKSTKDYSKVFESKQVHKNITDDNLNKNIVIDKGTVNKKDIIKNIATVQRDEVSDSKSVESSNELDVVLIYEPVMTTESYKTKKRVSVYDFLFKPPVYDDDEEINVYE